jgi:hypothetical protein
MALYYVFDDEATAVGAEHYITQIGGAPVGSIDPVTGEAREGVVGTTRWAIPWRRVDGKWVFPYVGDATIALYPDSVKATFAENYPHVLEEHDTAWLPPLDP